MKLTDTQLLLLSAASQRDDRALEPSPKLTGGAAGKVVAKLPTEGLVDEVRARGWGTNATALANPARVDG